MVESKHIFSDPSSLNELTCHSIAEEILEDGTTASKGMPISDNYVLFTIPTCPIPEYTANNAVKQQIAGVML